MQLTSRKGARRWVRWGATLLLLLGLAPAAFAEKPLFSVPQAPLAPPVPSKPIDGLKQPDVGQREKLAKAWAAPWVSQKDRVVVDVQTSSPSANAQELRVLDVAAELGDAETVTKLTKLEGLRPAGRLLAIAGSGAIIVGLFLAGSDTPTPIENLDGSAVTNGNRSQVPVGIAVAVGGLAAAVVGGNLCGEYHRKAFDVGAWYDHGTIESAIRLHDTRVGHGRLLTGSAPHG